MRLRSQCLWILPALSAGLLQAQETRSAEPQTPSFGTKAETVVVDTVVADKYGAPVPGLTREDFVLTEDGQPQQITSFEATRSARQPQETATVAPQISSNTDPRLYASRSFAVIFDDLHIAKSEAKRARRKVVEFLDTVVSEGDTVTLAATGAGMWWNARMEEGRDKLLRDLDGVKGQYRPDPNPETITDYEALRIVDFCDREVGGRVAGRLRAAGVMLADVELSVADCAHFQVEQMAREALHNSRWRTRATLAVMERVVQSLVGVRGRKAILLVSDGFVQDFALTEFEDVMRSAQHAHAVVYFLHLRGPLELIPRSLWEKAMSVRGADDAATVTGGRTIRDDGKLAAQLRKLAAEAQTYYLLGYSSTNTRRDGRFRRIRVEVSRKGTSVRNRKGYFAPKEAAAGVPAAGPASLGMQEALDSPHYVSELGVRMAVLVGGAAPEGKTKVGIVTDVDVNNFAFREEDGRLEDAVEHHLVVTQRKTLATFSRGEKTVLSLTPETHARLSRTGLPLVQELDLAPGPYWVKALLREVNGEKKGTLTYKFEVPEPVGLRVTTPALSDALDEETDEAVPIARRTFAAAGLLYCQFEVLGGTPDPATGQPRVSAGWALRAVDGSGQWAGDATPIRVQADGRVVRRMDLSVDGLKPGDYTLTLDVKDEVAGEAVTIPQSFVLAAP